MIIDPPTFECDIVEQYDHSNNFFKNIDKLVKLQRMVRKFLSFKKSSRRRAFFKNSETETKVLKVVATNYAKNLCKSNIIKDSNRAKRKRKTFYNEGKQQFHFQ
jgi:hypothetical protein